MLNLSAIEKGKRFCFTEQQFGAGISFLKIDTLEYLSPTGVVCVGDGDQKVIPLNLVESVGDVTRTISSLAMAETFVFEPGGPYFTRASCGYVDSDGNKFGDDLERGVYIVVVTRRHAV